MCEWFNFFSRRNGLPQGICLLSIVLFSSIMRADQRQETFLQAARAYQDGNYEKACYLYEGLAEPSGVIWYNLGNCHFHLGNTCDALACWLRAVHDTPRTWRRAAWKNIVSVQQAKTALPTQLWWFDLLNDLCWLPLGWLQLLCLLSLIGLVSCIGYRVRTGVSVVMLGICLLACVWVAAGYHVRWTEQAVTRCDVVLRAGPGVEYSQLGSLPAYTIAAVIARDGQWCKLRGMFNTGWISNEDIAITH